MQDVNNDMDDLFRKASEEYPLKTDGADWDKVRARLEDDDEDTVAPPLMESSKRKRRALWLLLLLPLLLLFTTLYYFPNTENKNLSAANKKKTSEVATNEVSHLKKEQQSTTPSSQKNKSQLAPNNAQSFDAYGNRVLGKTNTSVIKNQTNRENFQSPVTEQEEADAQEKQTEEVNEKRIDVAKQPNEETPRIVKMRTDSSQTKNLLSQQPTIKDITTMGKADSSVASNKAAQSKKKAVRQPQQGFYAGAMASFDVSTIKLQKINKTGYGLNILVGYRFSKHVSVESGVSLTGKKYYTIGEYFDKSRTDIPEESKIIYTNGSCTMFEVPVVVKYDFAVKPKSNLFLTAGLSSYFMKEEKYDYYAVHSNNYYDAEKKYKNSGSNWFSVANVSIGYQLHTGKRTTLRIEPYIKMPLTGIGIAKLPITSIGVSAGFTRSF